MKSNHLETNTEPRPAAAHEVADIIGRVKIL
jgi:hypothetical protein